MTDAEKTVVFDRALCDALFGFARDALAQELDARQKRAMADLLQSPTGSPGRGLEQPRTPNPASTDPQTPDEPRRAR